MGDEAKLSSLTLNDLDDGSDTVMPAEEATADPVEPEAKAEPLEGEAPPLEGEDKPADPAKVADIKAAPTVKIYKVKVGDKDIDLPGSVKIPTVVDGKAEMPTIEELRSEYAGKTDWARKYQSLDTDKRTHQTEVTKHKAELDGLNGMLKAFTENVKTGTPESLTAAFDLLHETIGFSPVEGRKQLRSAALKLADQLDGMSPEERAQLDLSEENEYLKKRDQTRTEVEAKKADSQAVETRVNQILTTHKIDKKVYAEFYEELAASGQVDQKLITPELVGEYAVAVKKTDEIVGVLAELKDSSDIQDTDTALKHLQKAWGDNPELTREDIKDIATRVFGKNPVESVNKRLKKTAATEPVDKTEPLQKPIKKALLFDDLD